MQGENDIGQLCTVIQGRNLIIRLGSHFIPMQNLVGTGAVLGTPSEEKWPGVSQLPDFHKISFTETRQLSFRQILPDEVDDASRAMLERFLIYCPESRITAKQVKTFRHHKSIVT